MPKMGKNKADDRNPKQTPIKMLPTSPESIVKK